MTQQPTLTAQQARAVDQDAIERLSIPGLLLMENAGINATAALLNHLDAQCDLAPEQARVAVLCGGGNNGGDGYVIARHLHNWGAAVEITSAIDPAALTGDAAINHRICAAMGLPIRVLADPRAIAQAADQWAGCDVMVDALLGTGFRGQLRQPLASIIEAADAVKGPVKLAVDIPSGLDADTGRPASPTLRADLTVTFIARKLGFDAPGAAAYTGRVVVAEIGAPPQCLERVLADTKVG